MALGATRGDVLKIVFSSTAATVGTGVLSGVLLSLALDKVASHWVTETARDPVVLTGGILLLAVASVFACVVPARRAASVAPMEALRYE
jgi:ABC-type antimicrobial peptide transport system permease subunit